MNTKKFRTKTKYMEVDNARVSGVREVAMDIGYSAVKIFSPNCVASFPSYAKRVDKNFSFAGAIPNEAILYRNTDTDELWLVGEVAQNMISAGDTSDSESSLYGRERYFSPMFRVISDCGIGIAMMTNQYGYKETSDEIVLQTGLPEKYMNDQSDLKDSLSGVHNFAIKIGSGEWKFFRENIKQDNIFVISQPKGTLFSACIDNDGRFIPNAEKYLSSSIMVFDPGFGTLDLFPIISGVVQSGETYSDLGMKRVLQETSKLIKENYNIDIPVPSMQKCLETGTVRYINKRTFESKDYPFDKLLAEASNKVCEEAIMRMANAFNYMADFDYIIVTGGTGAAWLHNIEEKFKNMTLQILHGNQNNEDLSFIYSNVRGYYMYRLNQLKRARG